MPENSPSLPDFTRWPSFPFEGDMRVKALAAPVEVEPPRSGEDAADCVACNTPDDAYIWVSDRWRVRAMDRPTGLPVVLILECRSHLDLGDLPNLLAAELGVMTVRLERAIRSLDDVARVHVNRWGDGSAHLHMWFLARPLGRLQLRGTFLSLWDDILPVIPEHQWRENLALVAAWLAEFGGRSIAAPAHIQWQSPSRFSESPTAEAEEAIEPGPGVIPAQRRPADLSDVPTSPSTPAPAYAGEGRTLDLSGSAARAAAMAAEQQLPNSSQTSVPEVTPSGSTTMQPYNGSSETPRFDSYATEEASTESPEDEAVEPSSVDELASDSGTVLASTEHSSVAKNFESSEQSPERGGADSQASRDAAAQATDEPAAARGITGDNPTTAERATERDSAGETAGQSGSHDDTEPAATKNDQEQQAEADDGGAEAKNADGEGAPTARAAAGSHQN